MAAASAVLYLIGVPQELPPGPAIIEYLRSAELRPVCHMIMWADMWCYSPTPVVFLYVVRTVAQIITITTVSTRLC